MNHSMLAATVPFDGVAENMIEFANYFLPQMFHFIDTALMKLS